MPNVFLWETTDFMVCSGVFVVVDCMVTERAVLFTQQLVTAGSCNQLILMLALCSLLTYHVV